MKRISYLFITVFFTAVSCTTLDVFEKTKAFATHEWAANDKAVCSFEIKDTAARYNLFVVLRHEDAYKYKNIWLDIAMQSADSTIHVKRDFALADNSKWLGSAMSDIIEHRIKVNAVPIPLKKGNYTFTIQQAMREDPLPSILNAGIRIEKAKS